MSDELELPGDHGERRIPLDVLDTLGYADLKALEAAVSRAIATTPGLQVNVQEDLLTNELVVRWRTRRPR